MDGLRAPFGVPPLLHHEGARADNGYSRRAMLRLSGAAGLSFLTAACGGGGGSTGSGGSSAPVTIPTPGQTQTEVPVALTNQPVVSPTKTMFGVNYYDLFHRFITYAAPFNPDEQLKQLSDRNIRLVRFAAGPLWARDWKLWNADPDRYKAGLDRIFDAADKYGMHMIPVLMSAPFGLSDLMGERFSAWGNPASATRREFDRFIPDMVRRFRSHPSILMWELANEMNAFANTPTGYTFYPPEDIILKTVRTVADNYTSADMISVHSRFAELVRQEDPTRHFESGSTTPNGRQTRRSQGRDGLDSREEMIQAMTETLAGGSKMLSVHLYDDLCTDRFDKNGSTFAEMILLARKAADQNGAKLYLGEFGVFKSASETNDRTRFRQMIAEIKAANVDFASVWAYDWMHNANWNMSSTERSWMLDELTAANS
ncbi:MAG TPA: cellulase family glycosylhydrolase [Sphingobium sp.]